MVRLMCFAKFASIALVFGIFVAQGSMGSAQQSLAAEQSAVAALDPLHVAPHMEKSSDCGLIVTWDQQNMWCIQLALAHRSKAVEPESVKQMLEAIVDEHANVGVDRVVHCMFALCAGTLPPNLKSFYRQGWSGIFNEGDSGVVAMENAGHDLMQVLLDRCHHNGIEFMAGLRMNDRHGDPWQSPFGKEHPEWRLRDLHGMDYRHEGVRNTVFAVAEELVERYDVDGIELDWMRHCHMFNADEAEANAHLLTDLVSRIRRMLDEKGAQRGRRLHLGVRVPPTLTECQALGFEVKVWMQNGSIDYACPSDFFYNDLNTPTEDFVALARGSRCKIYPSVHAKIAEKHFHEVPSAAVYRALAKNFYAYGADGVSVYNFHYSWRADMGAEKDWPGVMHDLADLRNAGSVARGSRQYLLYPVWPRGKNPTGRAFDRYHSIDLARSPQGAHGSVVMRVAEDPKDPHFLSVLEFKVMGLQEDDQLTLSVNGQPTPNAKMEREFFATGRPESKGRELPPYWVCRVANPIGARWGDNELSLQLAPTAAQADSEKGVVAQEFIWNVNPISDR
ncbi:MAG: hypothetical protein O3C60_14890 [Planctomycetota bacterium]|nr:hypothetical protein [Planctomycetota bacterium]